MPFLPLGGQAVIEGVMMRSPSRVAVAVRRPDGSLAFLERSFESVTRRMKLLGLPVVRGAVSLFETLSLGITALNFSADEAARDSAPGAAAGKQSAWMSVMQVLTVTVSLGAGVLLFVVLPARLTAWLGFEDRLRFGLVDGAFRLSTYDPNDGAPAGEYYVSVIWPTDGREDEDKLNGRYRDPKTSQLTATVKEGSNELKAFRLK